MKLLIYILFVVFAYIIKYTFVFYDTEVKLITDINVKYNVTALILARGGSKGIYKKNLSLIQNKTLIRRTVEKLLKFNKFDSVWVSTDDDDISLESQRAGALVFRRCHKYAADNASSIIAVQEFIRDKSDVNIIALVQCTSPFLQVNDLEEAYQMITTFSLDSVFSATINHKLLWKIEDDGTIHPLNFETTNRPRRQDASTILTENGMFYFVKKSLINQGLLQGGKIGYVEIPLNRSLEIDTINDLYFAQILASQLD